MSRRLIAGHWCAKACGHEDKTETSDMRSREFRESAPNQKMTTDAKQVLEMAKSLKHFALLYKQYSASTIKSIWLYFILAFVQP